MAIWQFDCYIISKKNVDTNIYSDFEDIIFWGKQNKSIEKIDFLKKERSWSDKTSQYGKEDETCIEFFYEDGFLKEINCRLDLRSLSKNVLQKILNYAREIGGKIFYNGIICEPNINEVIELIKDSDASRYCQDPRDYFQNLSNS